MKASLGLAAAGWLLSGGIGLAAANFVDWFVEYCFFVFPRFVLFFAVAGFFLGYVVSAVRRGLHRLGLP